jgi:sugar transferase (PEP-CTERM/EpsH1 system associated)
MPRLANNSTEVSFGEQAQGSLRIVALQTEATSVCPKVSPILSSAEAKRVTSSSPLRILHVIDRLGVGGTEHGLVKVIQGLESSEFEHRICAIRSLDESWARANHLEDRAELIGQVSDGRQFLIGRLARFMRSFRPHIVHSRNWGAIEAIPAARLARIPVAIHSEHGYEVEMTAGLPLRRRVLRKAAYVMADAVFTVTEELRTYHARQAWTSAKRIRVLPNGVDISRFAPRTVERMETRKRLGLSSECFVVGTIGRLVKIKDHLTLLRAAEQLADSAIPIHVLIGGAGPELASLRQVVASSQNLAGRVTFLGSIDNTPEILNAMDVFVLPSLNEGMSNTLLEAMASGLPVVATRVGGNPELVEKSSSGWLFQPGDTRGLASHLEQLSSNSNLRRELGNGARDRAVSHFSLEGMIARYRELYLGLAKQRNIYAEGWN